MIYITGDTHIPVDINKLSTKSFREQKNLTKSDYIIICGDFGAVWDLKSADLHWIKWLNEKNFTTLFIDGNHENFDLLNTRFDVVNLCNGKAHKISDSVYHLMRGEVFTIDNKKIFVMGGAQSHDKEYRKININWWDQELPSKEEYDNANNNLAKHNHKVDYVITHCAGTSIQNKMSSHYESNMLTDYFDELNRKLTYKKWYFGHYHIDENITDKNIAIFDKIISI